MANSTFSAPGSSGTCSGSACAHERTRAATATHANNAFIDVMLPRAAGRGAFPSPCESAPSQHPVVPEEKLDRTWPAVEDVVVRTRHVSEIMRDSGGGPGPRDAEDRLPEVIFAAREETKLEGRATRARREREGSPVGALTAAEGRLDAAYGAEGVRRRQADAKGDHSAERNPVEPCRLRTSQRGRFGAHLG